MARAAAHIDDSPVSTTRPIDYSIDIVNLSKRFKRKTLKSGYTTIKSSLLNFWRKDDGGQENHTTVIDGLTMRIPKGASVGVIGKNGSGKSTLLKLITGIYKPDTGSISVKGRIAALIELGAGFHPDFSGRENLYLGGVMHGLSKKEIDERFKDIVEFAELEHVIDDPVRTYSSGMFMRLGFSLAVHTDPDVLIVDEVLAVGDARFVSKCKDKVSDLRREGKTLILVTHDLEAVELWCDEALWLNDGIVRDRGDPRRVIDHYRQFVEKGEELDLFENQNPERAAIDQGEPGNVDTLEFQRWGSREIEITKVRLLDKHSAEKLLFHPEDEAIIEIGYLVNEAVEDMVFGIGINRTDGLVVHGSNTDIEKIEVSTLTGSGVIRYRLKRIGLLDGSYTLDVAAHRKDGYPYDYHKSVVRFAVRWPLRQAGVYLPEHSWEVQ